MGGCARAPDVTRTRVRGQYDDPALDALWGRQRRDSRLVLDDAANKRWLDVEVTQLMSQRKRSVTVRLP